MVEQFQRQVAPSRAVERFPSGQTPRCAKMLGLLVLLHLGAVVNGQTWSGWFTSDVGVGVDIRDSESTSA
eukprot:1185395-Prorocentrum_minimum.AAC.6